MDGSRRAAGRRAFVGAPRRGRTLSPQRGSRRDGDRRTRRWRRLRRHLGAVGRRLARRLCDGSGLGGARRRFELGKGWGASATRARGLCFAGGAHMGFRIASRQDGATARHLPCDGERRQDRRLVRIAVAHFGGYADRGFQRRRRLPIIRIPGPDGERDGERRCRQSNPHLWRPGARSSGRPGDSRAGRVLELWRALTRAGNRAAGGRQLSERSDAGGVGAGSDDPTDPRVDRSSDRARSDPRATSATTPGGASSRSRWSAPTATGRSAQRHLRSVGRERARLATPTTTTGSRRSAFM